MKYYLCIKEPEVKEEECDLNMFIKYTFDNRRWKSRYYTTPNAYNYNDYYDSYGNEAKRYNFHENWIYKSYNDGVSIEDDFNVVHSLKTIGDCFLEFNFELSDDVKRLIERKEKEGARITVTPIAVLSKGITFYHVECYINIGNFFSTTHEEGVDAYEAIIQCFKRFRTGTLSGYYQKIKEVLDRQKHERIRKHT